MPPSAAHYASSLHERIVVGMGDLGVSTQGQELVTHALGSCVAVCVHAPHLRLGAMLHFMLPDSRVDGQRAQTQAMAFADLGVPAMLEALQATGADRRTLSAKLVGGAAIPGAPSLFAIGKRNILAARQLLWKNGIRTVGQDVGGEISRTVRFDVASGAVVITSPGLPTRTLP